MPRLREALHSAVRETVREVQHTLRGYIPAEVGSIYGDGGPGDGGIKYATVVVPNPRGSSLSRNEIVYQFVEMPKSPEGLLRTAIDRVSEWFNRPQRIGVSVGFRGANMTLPYIAGFIDLRSEEEIREAEKTKNKQSASSPAVSVGDSVLGGTIRAAGTVTVTYPDGHTEDVSLSSITNVGDHIIVHRPDGSTVEVAATPNAPDPNDAFEKELGRQYTSAQQRGYIRMLVDAANQRGIPPSFLVAVASRETGIVNKSGDGGHGHGIIQIDDRWHQEFLSQHANWEKDPEPLVQYGAGLLAGHYAWATKKFPSVSQEERLRIAAAAYNAGQSGARRGLNAGDVDRYTAEGNYGSDVLKRMRYFQRSGL